MISHLTLKDFAVVSAAELAFAQMAQEKGQWTAFAATAAPDATTAKAMAPIIQYFAGLRRGRKGGSWLKLLGRSARDSSA